MASGAATPNAGSPLHMPIAFSKIRGIVFDLDGTLIDSYEAITESLNHAMARAGLAALPEARVKEMVGMGLETLIARAMGEARVEAGVRDFRARYAEICEARTRLLPGVGSTVETLRSRGYAMSVATNKPAYFATRLLEALGVASCFLVVLGPDMVENKKPHPEMVHRAMERMGTDAASTLYVGDMEIDIQTARAAGVSAVVLPTGSRTETELSSHRPDLLLRSFENLLELLPGPGPEDAPG